MSRLVTLLLTGLLLGSATARAAGQPPYATSLARVYQGLLDIATTVDGCSTLQPATASANRAALRAWQARHRPVRQELDQRYAQWLMQAAGTSPARQQVFARIMRDKFQQRRTVVLAQLRADPAGTRRLCHNYAQQLQTDLDPARYWATDLQRLRQLQPLAASRS